TGCEIAPCSTRDRRYAASNATVSTATAMTPESRSVASTRSEEHTSELQSPCKLVCRLLLEKKKRVLDSLLARCATRSQNPRSHRLRAPGLARQPPRAAIPQGRVSHRGPAHRYPLQTGGYAT